MITKRMFKIERDEDGSKVEYRCPKCGDYWSRKGIVWERLPGEGDPGKIDCCCHCDAMDKIGKLFLRMKEQTEHPFRMSA